MKQEIVEEVFTTDSETPKNVELAEPTPTLPEFMNDPQQILSIISSNQELIYQQALTIKHLQTENAQLKAKLATINNKYQTLLSLTSPSVVIDSQNPPNCQSTDSKSLLEEMVSKILLLEESLSLTKVQLGLKEDELLQHSLYGNQHKKTQASRRTPEVISRENLQELFEPQSPEKRRATLQKKEQMASKQLLDQWNRYIDSYGTSEGKLEKFKEKINPLIKKFIPQTVRNSVWSYLLPNRLGITNALYINLLERRTKNWVCPKVKQQIDRDIKRSFSGKTQYQTTTGLVFQVCQFLQLFHLYRPDISYLQGMTYPAIILIPILGKIKAFTVFCNIVLGNSFFRQAFNLQNNYVSTVCRAFELLLAEYQPNLQQQLKKHGIESQIYLIEWIFTIFSRGLSYQTILNFWDHLLYYQEVALFRMGLCVFEQLSPLLLTKNYEQSIEIIRNFGHHLDEDRLLDCFCVIRLNKEKVTKALEKARKL